jgi:hypothetical protein
MSMAAFVDRPELPCGRCRVKGLGKFSDLRECFFESVIGINWVENPHGKAAVSSRGIVNNLCLPSLLIVLLLRIHLLFHGHHFSRK